MILRKVLIGFLAVLLVFSMAVLGAVLGLYYNQNSLLKAFLGQVNENIQGAIEVEGIYVAPWANFPYISIDLKKVKLYESDAQNQRPLLQFEDIYVGFDIWDILKKEFNIKSLRVEKGWVHLTHEFDSTYNIKRALELKNQNLEVDTGQTALHIDIRKFGIKDLEVIYQDLLAQRETDLKIVHTIAKIKLKKELFHIDLVADAQLDVLERDNPTFFTNKRVHLDFEMNFDQAVKTIELIPSYFILNDARFRAEGTVDLANDLDLDLRLRGDKPDFGVIAAFLPDDIAKELMSYKNEGKIYFEGKVQGKSINGHMPLISVDFGCEEGYFLNPTVQKKLDELRFSGHFTNGDQRTLRSSQLEIKNFHTRPEQGIFVGNLFIRNFIDPFVRVDVHADLDLDFLGKFFNIKDFEGVKGHVLLDMNFNEIIDLNFGESSLAQLKKGIDSELTIEGLHFNMPEFGFKIKNGNAHAIMKEGAVTLDSLSFNINQNDLWIAGTLSDFPAVFHRYDTPISLSMEAKSSLFNLHELLSFNPKWALKMDESIQDLSVKVSFNTIARELFEFQYLPQGEFFIDDLYAQLTHYPHKLHNFHADVIITEEDFELIDFSGIIDQSDFHFSGKLRNYTKWFQEKPKGDSEFEFDLRSNLFKLSDVLTYKGTNYVPESYRDEVLQNANIHGRVDMHYDDGFKSIDLYLDQFTAKMNLHPLKFEKFKGRAHYENHHLVLENFGGKMGKSDFKVYMSYFLGDDKNMKSKENFLRLTSSTLDLDALLGYDAHDQKTNHDSAYNVFSQPFPNIKVNVDIGKLYYHKYWLQDFKADLRILEDHYVYVDTLTMKVADGALQMKGYFNGSDPNNIYFQSTIYAQQLDIDRLMLKFDNFGQDQLVNENIHGKISGTIQSTFKMHPDFTPIVEKSKAKMDLTIVDGSIVNFAPMQTMSRYFKDKNLNRIRFDTLTNTLELEEGTLRIPHMVINSTLGHIHISGSQKVDLSMEYFLRIPLKMATKAAWRHVFSSKNTVEVDPEQIDEIERYDPDKKVRYVNLRLEGTPQDFRVSLGRERNRVSR